jgi:hypothetical protein
MPRASKSEHRQKAIEAAVREAIRETVARTRLAIIAELEHHGRTAS